MKLQSDSEEDKVEHLQLNIGEGDSELIERLKVIIKQEIYERAIYSSRLRFKGI